MDYTGAYGLFAETMKRESSRHSTLDEYYQKVFRHQKGMELLEVLQNTVNGPTATATIRIKVLPANDAPAEYYTIIVTLIGENGYWKIDEWKT